MFSSRYFANGKKYFALRFLCKPLLYRWFAYKAQITKESKTFSFPECLQNGEKTVIFMPEDKEVAKVILSEIPDENLKKILFVAHSDLEILFSKKRAQVTYYTDEGCRYGEPLFDKLEYQVKTFAPTACVYPGPYKPQFLYLALVSGAACRVGFDCAKEYPFLNLSLHPLKTISPARMMARYFTKGKKG